MEVSGLIFRILQYITGLWDGKPWANLTSHKELFQPQESWIVAQVGVCHFMFSLGPLLLIPFRNINHALHRSLKKLLFKEVPCLTITGHRFERSWWNVSLTFDYFAAVYCTLMFLLVCMCTSDITVEWYKIPLQRSTTWCHLVMGHTVITCHQLTLW